MKNTFISVVVIAIIVLLNGCSPDESKWKDVVKQNTVESYGAYLKEFQGGVHKAEAEQRIEKIERKTAFTEKNEQKILTCINKYKNSSNVKVAEEMLWSIKWPAVKIDKANSLTVCKGGSSKSMGELVFSKPAGSAMVNFEGPGGKN